MVVGVTFFKFKVSLRENRDKVNMFSKKSEGRLTASSSGTMQTASGSVKQNIPACL